MRKIVIGFILNSILVINCLSQQGSGIFLELPSSVRAGGMGESFTALSDEPFGINYNPAGIAFVKSPVVSFLHQRYLIDISGNYFGFVYPTKNFAVGTAPSFLWMKDEPMYDYEGRDIGEKFSYRGQILPVAVSCLFKNVSIGGTAKYYSEQIDNYFQRSMSFDLGAIYRVKNLRFGLSLLNLFGKLEEYKLPKTIKIGVASIHKNIILTGEFDRQLIRKESSFSLGAELLLSEVIYLRAGYNGRKDFSGMTAGIGAKLSSFELNYAFSSYSDLGNTHRVGISVGLFKVTEEPLTPTVTPALPAQPKLPSKPSAQPTTPPTPTIPALLEKKINLAVTEFIGKNVSASDASIVADFLRTELVNIGYYKVMDRANMEMILAEQKLQMSGCTEQECAVKIGKILNVQQMVVGTLSKLLDTYYITVNLVDVETGEILKSVKEKAINADELSNACRIVAEKLVK